MAVRSIQGARREQKSQVKCVQVNPFHEAGTLLQFTPSSLQQQPQAACSWGFA